MFACLFIFRRHSTQKPACDDKHGDLPPKLPHEHWAEIYKQKPLVILKKTHLFQSISNNLYRTHLILSKNKPSFLKSKMQLVFMAVHSRYGHHYLKDILCSTDLWRGRGSEEFTLPHLLQDTGELVHINRGGVVFSYSLSKNWWEPNLESGQQEICDDPSSVRSGTVVLQSVALGPMACRACWMRGQTISSLQCRPVREPWMMLSSVLPLQWIYADPHHYWSASIVINLPNSIFTEAFSEPKTDAFPAIVESNSEAGDSSVKGIMDHYCLVQGTWHGHHTAWVQQSTRVKGILTACYVLWAKRNACHLTRIKCEKY